MVYIKRDANGKITEIHKEQTSQGQESITSDSPEVLEFLSEIDTDESRKLNFIASDLSFIRVLEDLIDILIDKNIINLTDFPPQAIDKLLNRQSVREHFFKASGGMEFDDEDN